MSAIQFESGGDGSPSTNGVTRGWGDPGAGTGGLPARGQLRGRPPLSPPVRWAGAPGSLPVRACRGRSVGGTLVQRFLGLALSGLLGVFLRKKMTLSVTAVSLDLYRNLTGACGARRLGGHFELVEMLVVLGTRCIVEFLDLYYGSKVCLLLRGVLTVGSLWFC